MQQIILESSPAFVLLCVGLAVGSAFVLYRMKHPWTKTWNRILFVFRSVLIFSVLFLLLGPIIRQINNLIEKPLFVVLYDNSSSVKETTDSTALKNLDLKLKETAIALAEKNYEVKTTNLQGDEIETPVFSGSSTDLTLAIRKINSQYEGRKIGGVVLVSDGIYNAGISPLY